MSYLSQKAVYFPSSAAKRRFLRQLISFAILFVMVLIAKFFLMNHLEEKARDVAKSELKPSVSAGVELELPEKS